MGFFLYRYPDKILILYIQHEIKEEDDDGDAVVEDDNEDVEVEVDDDPTLEAEENVEEEPLASSTPRHGHLPRPLVRSGFAFLIRIQETSSLKKIF